MKNVPIYEALAQAFTAEGVDTHFTLMGDGNMHWASAMKNLDGMASFSARHEHCACAMAMGYHLATGKVGVASVTCGPGFTQITTALTVAARGRIPLVVFAGEAPINARWYNQAFDQPPLAAATGAHYISAYSVQRMYQYVREAFYVARHEHKPVVLGVPYDLQKQPLPDLGEYQPSCAVLPARRPIPPDAAQIDALVAKLSQARCPIVLAGRGVMRADAALEVLRARGKTSASIRSAELARRISDEPADAAQFPLEPGLLDPRRAIDELDRVIPKDYDSVSGSGHQSYFHSTMRGRRPENYHAIREFGAIGNGVSFAIGVAAAKNNGKVVLFEGDGSLLMHIQELEMVQRHRLKLLICVLNDGAYGAEIHKLRSDGIDDSGAIFGRTDLAAIARGFGLRGANITELTQFKPLFDAYAAQDVAEVWNIHVSDRVVSPHTRRGMGRGHGRM